MGISKRRNTREAEETRMKHKERNIGKGKGDETQSQTGTQKEIHNIETKY